MNQGHVQHNLNWICVIMTISTPTNSYAGNWILDLNDYVLEKFNLQIDLNWKSKTDKVSCQTAA